MNIEIRKANVKDIGIIFNFIKKLADFEKSPKEVTTNPHLIKKKIFQKNSNIFSLIALNNDKPVGFVVYFFNYSTWTGKKGLYIEDLFIDPEIRRCGVGSRIMKSLSKIAINNDCARMEFNVLDWNEDAIKFYQKFNAKPMKGWTIFRIERNSIEAII
tara:strand:- start:1541 stop:2014 length:474 start_codon:yes stop_codon:yes gene_type:complete